MATYIIMYDINQEGEGYSEANKKLIDRIKELFSTYWHYLDSTWIVVTEDMDQKQIRNDLKEYLDENDELLVVKSGKDGAWHGFSKKASDWLVENL